MKAVRFHGKEDLRLEEVPVPELLPGTVRLRPAWTGICGSDLHLYLEGPMAGQATADVPHPISGETTPVVSGHEFSAVVAELGEGVDGLTVGESVVVEPFMVCGECPPCQDGLYNCCQKMGFIGIAGRGGGLAEEIVVERRWVHPVGDIPLDEAALIEPLAVAYHGVRLAGVQAGDVVLVGGAGPIGLLTGAVLKALGATVIISEVSSARKDTARETGVADHVIDPTEDDLVARVHELTNGKGADVAIECAGVQPVFNALMASLKAGGAMQIVALYEHDPVIPMGALLFKEITIRGAIGYADDHPAVIKLVQEGKVDLKPFITARIKAADIVEQGYKELVNNKDRQVKIIVEM